MYPRPGLGSLGANEPPGPVSGSTSYTDADYAMVWGALQSGGYLPAGGERLRAETEAWHVRQQAFDALVQSVAQKGYRLNVGTTVGSGTGEIVNPLTGVTVANIYDAGFTGGALPVVRDVAVVEQAVVVAAGAPVPPPGWHQSPPTPEHPSGGWYGADGLFYEGVTPWLDPHAVGRSVQVKPDAGLPPGGQSTPPVAPQTTAPVDSQTTPVEVPFTVTSGGPGGFPTPVLYQPSSGAPMGPLSTPMDTNPESTPLLAGMSGGTMLLIGGAVIGGLFLMGRKGPKGRRR